MDIIIGIGEYEISNRLEDTIKTLALASCVAVTFHCPIKKVSAMVHIALPSPSDCDKRLDKPAYYATIGIPEVINRLMWEYGCSKKTLSTRLFGGACSIKENDFFNIGEKNIDAVKSILQQRNIKINSETIGGFVSRSVEMRVDTGELSVSTQPIRI